MLFPTWRFEVYDAVGIYALILKKKNNAEPSILNHDADSRTLS